MLRHGLGGRSRRKALARAVSIGHDDPRPPNGGKEFDFGAREPPLSGGATISGRERKDLKRNSRLQTDTKRTPSETTSKSREVLTRATRLAGGRLEETSQRRHQRALARRAPKRPSSKGEFLSEKRAKTDTESCRKGERNPPRKGERHPNLMASSISQ